MKSTIIAWISFLFICKEASTQEEFFRSNVSFTENELKNFYSSVTLNGNQVLFSASDYKLYAYERRTGKLLWVSHLAYKTGRGCFAGGGLIYVPYYINEHQQTAVLDSATGKLIRLLPFGHLETNPLLRDGILYGTAIIDGGMLFAYDVKNDSMLWSRFLAHGVSTQPYYFPEYIYANAEAHNWVKLNYRGEILDSTCQNKAEIFVKDIPCIESFNALAHDKSLIRESVSEKYFGDPETISPDNTLWGTNKSFVLADDKVLIMGNKGKRAEVVELARLMPDSAFGYTGKYNRLLSATEKTVIFLFQGQLMTYDHVANKIVKSRDLLNWKPSQVVLDGDRIWLVSGNDGLLYGLKFP
jgi:hypothetical protein